MKNSKFVWPSSIVIFVGIGIYIYLAFRHYDLIYSLGGGKSFCNVSDRINCDAVNTSSFSEFLGIPVAIMGALAYSVMLFFVLGIKVLEGEEQNLARRSFLYLSGASSLFSLWLLFVQLFILKKICLMCLAADATAFTLFIFAWIMARPEGFRRLKEDVTFTFFKLKYRGTLGLLIAIPVLSWLGHGVFKSALVPRDVDKYVDQYIMEWKTNPPQNLELSDVPFQGNPNSSIQIVEFADFQCPACRMASQSLHVFLDSNKDRVKFYYINYPLNSDCNKKLKNKMHPLACEMAKASMCMHQEGRFWDAHQWLFEHQETATINFLSEMSKDLSFDQAKIQACMNDSKTLDLILSHSDRGSAAGINATPSLFVNGRLLPSGTYLPVLRKALESLQP